MWVSHILVETNDKRNPKTRDKRSCRSWHFKLIGFVLMFPQAIKCPLHFVLSTKHFFFVLSSDHRFIGLHSYILLHFSCSFIDLFIGLSIYLCLFLLWYIGALLYLLTWLSLINIAGVSTRISCSQNPLPINSKSKAWFYRNFYRSHRTLLCEFTYQTRNYIYITAGRENIN